MRPLCHPRRCTKCFVRGYNPGQPRRAHRYKLRIRSRSHYKPEHPFLRLHRRTFHFVPARNRRLRRCRFGRKHTPPKVIPSSRHSCAPRAPLAHKHPMDAPGGRVAPPSVRNGLLQAHEPNPVPRSLRDESAIAPVGARALSARSGHAAHPRVVQRGRLQANAGSVDARFQTALRSVAAVRAGAGSGCAARARIGIAALHQARAGREQQDAQNGYKSLEPMVSIGSGQTQFLLSRF